ncbi:MAG: DUF5131 family protein [Nitrososphaerota archaeon]|nr:DUF5131 family protein [Nitrososphaerota archaeon]
MNRTTIAWCTHTSNPIYAVLKGDGKRGWACVKLTEGCRNCYASAMNVMRGTGLPFDQASMAKVEFVLSTAEIEKWMAMKKPAKIFLLDMGDMFLREISDQLILTVLMAAGQAKQHTFMVLTKRPLRMRNFQQEYFPEGFPPNVWVGTSVEGAEVAPRIDVLRGVKVRSGVRFVSNEPALSRLGRVDLSGISWVITGGESGPHHRPMPLDWAREVRDLCIEQGVAWFFKQTGGLRPGGDGVLDGRVWREWPES